MKKLLSAILIIAFAMIPLSLSANAESDYVPSLKIGGEVDYNQSDNDYYNYSYTVDSYIEELSSGYRRVYYHDDVLTIDNYDSSWNLTSTKAISKSGYLFGGYYSGSQYNYLVWGQENPDEDDSKEVLRIEKYTKDWKTLSGYAQVFGANTTIPFRAGSLRMTETAGKLYIHTCHQMYKNKNDGLNHQANMTFVIDTATMTVSDSWYKVMNIGYGYVSHSFNQFILTDGKYVYRADHGDAYPRSVCITRVAVGDKITKVKYTNALPISGAIGDNFTGVTIGGFEMSANNLLIAGSTADQSDPDIGHSSQKNIFITVTDKNLSSTSVKYITDYTADSGIDVRTPHLVKINDNRFLILWEELEGLYIYTKFATIDGSGNLTSEITDTRMRLSDCKPILLKDGTVCWYASTSSYNTVYFVNPDKPASANDNFVKATEGLSATSTADSVTLSWNRNYTASGYAIEKYSDGKWSRIKTIDSNNITTYTESGLTASTLYSYRIRAYNDIRQTRIWENTYKDISIATCPTSVKGLAISDSASDSLSVSWTENSGASGYSVELNDGSGWKAVKSTSSTACTISDLSPSTSYKLRVRAWNDIDGTKKYGGYSSELTAYTNPKAVEGFRYGGKSGDALRVNWDENASAGGYIVEIYKNGTWVRAARIAGNKTTTCRVSGLSSSTTYSFRIKAYRIIDGVALYSTYSDSIELTTNPSAVTGLSEGGRTGNALRLNWNKNESAGGYIVEMYKDNKWTRIARIANPATTTYRVAGLDSFTTYSFRIRAFKIKDGEVYYSAYSSPVALTTNPSSVQNLTVTKTTSDTAYLSWSKNTTARGYIVEVYLNGKWTRKIKFTSNVLTAYHINGLSSDTTYKVRVRTFNIKDSVAYYGAASYIDVTTS